MGEDITQSFAKRLMSLTLVDNNGFEADTLSITIDGHDGLVALPKTGAKLDVFKERMLVDKDSFVIDSITHSDAPDVIELGGKSADFRPKFIAQYNHVYPQKHWKRLSMRSPSAMSIKHPLANHLRTSQ